MLFRRPSFLLSVISSPLLAFFALTATGCTPSIGDSCQVSTNCSSSGDRLCDLSQPGGYCTVFNCQPNKCPEEAVCIEFQPAVPGCFYDDRNGQRSGKSFCAKRCDKDSDCRDQYKCADTRQSPWNALVLDDNQTQRVCVPIPALSINDVTDAGPDGSVPVPPPPLPDGGDQPLVCTPGSPSTPPAEIDASSPSKPDASAPDAGAPSDAGAPDAGDAAADGGR